MRPLEDFATTSNYYNWSGQNYISVSDVKAASIRQKSSLG